MKSAEALERRRERSATIPTPHMGGAPDQTSSSGATPTPQGELNVEEVVEALKRVLAPRPQMRGNVQTEPLIIDAGGIAAIEQVVQFNAQSLRVDNFTTRWVCIPGLDLYVPPSWIGLVRTIGVHMARLRVVQRPPGTLGGGAINAGQMAFVTVYEDWLPEVPGVGGVPAA